MPPRTTSTATTGSLRPRVGLWLGRSATALGLAVAGLALTGCDLPWSSPPTAERPEVRPGELDAADGAPCPQELPIGDDPGGSGFGVEAAAEELPTLLEPQEAWVCEYKTVDDGAIPSGGATYGWGLTGQPVPVAPGDVPDLEDALNDLSLPDLSAACTADLGPRWMVVWTHDGDLTGAVVDDYGCRSVRLTDNPHTTPPGADGQDGTVAGVLGGGTAILDALGVGRTN